MTTAFDDVVNAWDHADPSDIHPLRNVNEDEYWASGVAQAEDAAIWIPEGGTVMDFGCGDGRLTLPLALFGFKVIAADASEAMLHRVRQNVRHRASNDLDITYLRTDGVDLQEGPESCDVIVARAVLIHHSHDDAERIVQKMVTVLKPGGYLIADWPVGVDRERSDWIDVTTWAEGRRLRVGTELGLELVDDGTPTVWMKI